MKSQFHAVFFQADAWYRAAAGHDNIWFNGLNQARYAIDAVRTKEKLRAREVPARSAGLLGLSGHEPILEIERVAYTYHEQPVEFGISHVNTENHAYLNDLI